MAWLALSLLFAAAGAYLLLNVILLRIIRPIFERAPMLIAPYAPPDPRAEKFEIPTTNGLTLSACLYRREESESRGVVIFCPEFGGSKWTALHYCQGLWEAGFDVLAFDFRNQGESAHLDTYRELHWLSEYEIADVHAVIDFVRKQPELQERSIGLFGVSRGGAAALAAGSESPDVELIATDSAFPTEPMMLHYVHRWFSLYVPEFLFTFAPEWHVRLTMRIVKWFTQRSRGCRYAEVIPRLKRIDPRKKALLIAGGRDSFVDVEISKQLKSALGDQCEDLWVVKGAKHNSARNMAPEEYDERLVDFFNEMAPLRQPDQIDIAEPTVSN